MSENGVPALEARGLYHIYREGQVRTVALRGAGLVLEAASWTSLMGPSGSGKSTLLHVLAGLLEPTAGSVTVDGEDVTRLPRSARDGWRRRSVGVILQRDNLHPHLDVGDNVALPMRLHGRAADEVRARVDELLQQVGLADRHRQPVGQLSGGEAQRAAIAVALANRPRVLLADEPTGELDEATAAGVLDLLDALRANEGAAVLTVTHNAQVSFRASRTLRMDDGLVSVAP
ncbi:MAG: ABC transporter ATP-binding protein [Chloroflexota bacterium]